MTDDDELIERLLTRAAMIMEDSVESALIRGGAQSLDYRITTTLSAGEDSATLVPAAAAIRRRASQGS